MRRGAGAGADREGASKRGAGANATVPDPKKNKGDAKKNKGAAGSAMFKGCTFVSPASFESPHSFDAEQRTLGLVSLHGGESTVVEAGAQRTDALRTATHIVVHDGASLGDAVLDGAGGHLCVHVRWVHDSLNRQQCVDREALYEGGADSSAAGSADSSAARSELVRGPLPVHAYLVKAAREISAPVEEEAIEVLPKYACHRKQTKEADRNVAVTSYLAKLKDWWDYGVLHDHGNDDEYNMKVTLLIRVVALLRVWPTALTPENWPVEREKLLAQHYISANTCGAHGGWIMAIEQLVRNGTVDRPDSWEKWAADPRRNAAYHLRKLKLGIGIVKATELVDQHGVNCVADLVSRRLTVKGLSDHQRSQLEFTEVSQVKMTGEEQAILIERMCNSCEACTFAGPLDVQVVGSYRRGVRGGHDVDVLLRLRSNDPKYAPHQAYGFDRNHGLALNIVAELQRLLAGQTVFGEPFHIARKPGRFAKEQVPRRYVVHGLFRSPTVQGAVRLVDFVLVPTALWPHSLLGWSGSTGFLRSFADYVNHAHEVKWANVPDKQPIVGVKGYRVDQHENRVGEAIYGRTLDLDKGEHWAWSQSGIRIIVGARTIRKQTSSRAQFVYEECNDHIKTEKDIFDFFHLQERPPEERCC